VPMATVMSTREAAEALNVSERRIRELVTTGQLPAERVAGRLLVDVNAVHRRAAGTVPATRPLSARMAWGLLWTAAGESASWLSATERARVRRLLRERDVTDWAWLCRRRAAVHRLRVLPSYLEPVLDAEGVVRSGVSARRAYRLDVLATDEGEAYTATPTLQALTRDFGLGADTERPNLTLRVPALDWQVVGAGRAVMPLTVVAVDLLDSGEPRSMRSARRLLQTARATGHR